MTFISRNTPLIQPQQTTPVSTKKLDTPQIRALPEIEIKADLKGKLALSEQQQAIRESKKTLQEIQQMLHRYPENTMFTLQETHDILPDLLENPDKEVIVSLRENLKECKETSSAFDAHLNELLYCLNKNLEGYGKVADNFKLLQQSIKQIQENVLRLETKIDILRSSTEPLKVDEHLQKYSPSVYKELEFIHSAIKEVSREIRGMHARNEKDLNGLENKKQAVIEDFKKNALPDLLSKLNNLRSIGYSSHIDKLKDFLKSPNFDKNGNIKGYNSLANEFHSIQQPGNLDQKAFDAQKLHEDYLRSTHFR